MSEIFMPSHIVYGKNSLDRLSFNRSEHTLLISDGGFISTRGFLSAVEDKLKRSSSKVSVIENSDVQELYSHASEIYFSDEYDSVIAIGGAQVIDCAMLISKESNAHFTAIPFCSACAVTDFDSEKYYEYRKSPDCIVLDPQLMHCASSGTVAYNGLACLAFGFDALCESSDPIIHSMAFDGAAGILRNIVSAFRGNMNAMERLMYAMYLCVAAHRNIRGAERSLISKTCNFFSQFGYPKTAVLAVCIPSILDFSSDMLKDTLSRLAFTLNVCYSDDSKETAAAKILDEVRKIQAILSVPRSISGFGMSSEDYNREKFSCGVPVDLLDLCFNGSFRFMKM